MQSTILLTFGYEQSDFLESNQRFNGTKRQPLSLPGHKRRRTRNPGDYRAWTYHRLTEAQAG